MVDNIEISPLTIVGNGSGLMFAEQERDTSCIQTGEHTLSSQGSRPDLAFLCLSPDAEA